MADSCLSYHRRWLKVSCCTKVARSATGRGYGLDRLRRWGSRLAWIGVDQAPPELVESSGR